MNSQVEKQACTGKHASKIRRKIHIHNGFNNDSEIPTLETLKCKHFKVNFFLIFSFCVCGIVCCVWQIHVDVDVHAQVCTNGSQSRMHSVFLYHSLPYYHLTEWEVCYFG